MERGAAGPKPVIVLEHGAWADASSWSEFIQRLQGDGFTAYAPPNPLRGLPQDSAYLHDFLTQNAALAGQPVVLVGHSYGGAVITNAAVGDPQVKALVYVDAFIPDQGETLGAPEFRARILPGRQSRRHLQFRALPQHHRRRRHLHQAEPGPRLLRQRPARQASRGHCREPRAGSRPNEGHPGTCRAAAQSLGHGFIASSMGTMRARASVRSTKLEVNSAAVAVSDRPAAGTSTTVTAK
jgi:pimeloyl-ACP methyl ester carboxylesterase